MFYSSVATLLYDYKTSTPECQIIFTSGDSSGTFPIQLSDKILQSHLALLFFSKCRCMVATRSNSRRQVHQSIQTAPFPAAPTPCLAAGFHVASFASILAPCALLRSVGGSVIDNRITLTRQRARTRPASRDEPSCDYTLVTRESWGDPLARVSLGGVERGASRARRAILYPRDDRPAVGYYGPVARSAGTDRSGRVARPPGGILSRPLACLSAPPFANLDHLFLTAAAILPPETLLHLSRGCDPRAAPRRVAPPGRGCAFTCGWTCASRCRARNRRTSYRRERASD